ncbi:MAG: hypothetical protein OSA99_18305 [Acidimicrobiales bacterium]|nr:hypothetical protein [Acidimicrobiales bacterium]
MKSSLTTNVAVGAAAIAVAATGATAAAGSLPADTDHDRATSTEQTGGNLPDANLPDEPADEPHGAEVSATAQSNDAAAAAAVEGGPDEAAQP